MAVATTDPPNLRLTAHNPSGTDLGSTYAVDMDGHTRATWDRGAYEYVAGTAPASLGAPTNLQINP